MAGTLRFGSSEWCQRYGGTQEGWRAWWKDRGEEWSRRSGLVSAEWCRRFGGTQKEWRTWWNKQGDLVAEKQRAEEEARRLLREKVAKEQQAKEKKLVEEQRVRQEKQREIEKKEEERCASMERAERRSQQAIQLQLKAITLQREAAEQTKGLQQQAVQLMQQAAALQRETQDLQKRMCDDEERRVQRAEAERKEWLRECEKREERQMQLLTEMLQQAFAKLDSGTSTKVVAEEPGLLEMVVTLTHVEKDSTVIAASSEDLGDAIPNGEEEAETTATSPVAIDEVPIGSSPLDEEAATPTDAGNCPMPETAAPCEGEPVEATLIDESEVELINSPVDVSEPAVQLDQGSIDEEVATEEVTNDANLTDKMADSSNLCEEEISEDQISGAGKVIGSEEGDSDLNKEEVGEAQVPDAAVAGGTEVNERISVGEIQHLDHPCKEEEPLTPEVLDETITPPIEAATTVSEPAVPLDEGSVDEEGTPEGVSMIKDAGPADKVADNSDLPEEEVSRGKGQEKVIGSDGVSEGISVTEKQQPDQSAGQEDKTGEEDVDVNVAPLPAVSNDPAPEAGTGVEKKVSTEDSQGSPHDSSPPTVIDSGGSVNDSKDSWDFLEELPSADPQPTQSPGPTSSGLPSPAPPKLSVPKAGNGGVEVPGPTGDGSPGGNTLTSLGLGDGKSGTAGDRGKPDASRESTREVTKSPKSPKALPAGKPGSSWV